MSTPLYSQKDPPYRQAAQSAATGAKPAYRGLIYLPLYLILPTAALSFLYIWWFNEEWPLYAQLLFVFLAFLAEHIFTASFFCSMLISFRQKCATGFYINTAFWGFAFGGALIAATNTGLLEHTVLSFCLYLLLSNISNFVFLALCCVMLLSGLFLFYRAVKQGLAEKSWASSLLYLPIPVSILYSFSALLTHMEQYPPEAAELTLSDYTGVFIMEAAYILLWLATLYASYRLCDGKAILRYLLYWLTPIPLTLLAAPLSLLFSDSFSVSNVTFMLLLMTSILLPLCVLTYPFFTLLLMLPAVYFLLVPLMAVPGILAFRRLYKKHPEQFTGRLAGLFSILFQPDKTRTRS